MLRLPYILALAALASACTNPGKCGEGDSDRCVEPTESDSVTATTPTGSTGSTGPATPTTSGTGESSTGTDTTTAMPAELMRCIPTCTIDADCTIDGMDIDFACITGACSFPACIDDAGCQQLYGGWTVPCTMTAECKVDEACVDIGGGQGRCARQPGRSSCADFGLVELMQPALEGGRLLTVCGNIDAVCKDDACTIPCKSDADCPAQQGTPHCQVDTGECTCASDDECTATMKPGLTACMDGRCGCSDDADCAGGTNVDTCVAGSCGCSSTAVCTDPFFDNAVPVCEPA